MAEGTGFEGWAILELMGHRRLAGHLSEQVVGGASLIRIDVPHGPADAQTTQFYSPAAVYCITPTTEEVARLVAAKCRLTPVHSYELAHVPSQSDRDDDREF
ncbi:MAG: acetyltransferase [bacterium]